MSQFIPWLVAQSQDLAEHYNKNTRRGDIDFPEMPGSKRSTNSSKRRRVLPSAKKTVLAKATSTRAKSVVANPSYFKYHISAFPQKQYETLRYVYQGVPTTVAVTSMYDILLCLNGPYDPDTITASSAAGWTKYMAVYTKALVRNARMKVIFSTSPPTAATQNVVTCGLSISTNYTAFTNVQAAIQSGLCVYNVLNANSDVRPLEIDVDCNKFLGIKNGQDAANDYACTPTANPAQLVVGHAWVYNPSSVQAASITYNIVIDYDCLFYDPIPVT